MLDELRVGVNITWCEMSVLHGCDRHHRFTDAVNHAVTVDRIAVHEISLRAVRMPESRRPIEKHRSCPRCGATNGSRLKQLVLGNVKQTAQNATVIVKTRFTSTNYPFTSVTSVCCGCYRQWPIQAQYRERSNNRSKLAATNL